MAKLNDHTTFRTGCVVLILMALLVWANTARAETSCRVADAYVEAGLIDEAKTVLKAEAAKEEHHECLATSLGKVIEAARNNARAIVDRQVAQARALQEAGEYAGALKLLQAASTDAAADESVSQALKDLKRAKAQADFQNVRELAAGGMQDEALKALEAALKDNPGSTIPHDLEYLSGGGIEEWRDAKKWLRNFAVPAAEIVLAAFLAWLGVHFIWRWSIAKPLLAIDAFDDSGMTPKQGKSVTALMQAAYQDFVRGHGTSATRISGNLEAVSLPTAVQQALPGPLQSKLPQAVLALFDKILPRRTYTVAGNLQNPGSKGAGLTIRIVSKKHQLGSMTLWEGNYRGKNVKLDSANPTANVEQNGDFDALAEYAAIWLLFTLKHGFGLRSALFRWPRMWWFGRKFGTRSWRAYALFRAGYRAEEARTPVEARELYVSALRVDPELSVAKINLGRLARQEKPNWQFARSLWEQCRRKGEKRWPYFSYPHEQSHYAAMYSLAVLAYEESEEKKEKGPRKSQEATEKKEKAKTKSEKAETKRKEAETKRKEAETKREKPDTKEEKSKKIKDGDKKKEIKKLKAEANKLKAEADKLKAEADKLEEEANELKAEADMLEEEASELKAEAKEAGAEALKLAKELMASINKRSAELRLLSLSGRLDVRTDLRDYLEFLRPYANAMLGGLEIAIGYFPEGKRIIEELTKTAKGLPRFQYNLACSYSLWAKEEQRDSEEQKKYLDLSLDCLRNSFWLGEEIAKKAREGDLALKFVSVKRKNEFDAITKTPPSVPKEPKRYELERLRSIDRSYAEKLSEKKIESVSDLLFATETVAQRESLADCLGTGSELIAEWAHAMELASLRGVELEDVNLLFAADVRRLADLKGSDPAKLRLRLMDWAKTMKQAEAVPEDSVVDLWIREANQAQPYVKI